MNPAERDFVISLTGDVVKEYVSNEYGFFDFVADDVFESFARAKATDPDESDLQQYGEGDLLVSSAVMAILILAVKSLLKQGLILTRIAILEWVLLNRDAISEHLKSDNQRIALEILVKYLSK